MNKKNLSDLNIGQETYVDDILLTGSMRRRMQDLGVIEGAKIKCLQKSPKGNPVAYLIRGAAIALRLEDASLILTR